MIPVLKAITKQKPKGVTLHPNHYHYLSEAKTYIHKQPQMFVMHNGRLVKIRKGTTYRKPKEVN